MTPVVWPDAETKFTQHKALACIMKFIKCTKRLLSLSASNSDLLRVHPAAVTVWDWSETYYILRNARLSCFWHTHIKIGHCSMLLHFPHSSKFFLLNHSLHTSFHFWLLPQINFEYAFILRVRLMCQPTGRLNCHMCPQACKLFGFIVFGLDINIPHRGVI